MASLAGFRPLRFEGDGDDEIEDMGVNDAAAGTLNGYGDDDKDDDW